MSRRHDHHTHPDAARSNSVLAPFDPAWQRFADPECLRAVLIRIHNTPNGWNTDPDATDLVMWAGHRFAGLAAKHGLQAEDAMSAAFEAMRNPAARYGFDPWGVIVTAVATTLRAWQFADEALTSVETARRGNLSGCRAERFSERDLPVWERDPAFAVGFEHDQPAFDGPTVREQAERVADLFEAAGWDDRDQVTTAVEIVMRKLADHGCRPAALEALRRTRRWRAFTGLDARSWTGLVRILLGVPQGRDLTDTSRGVLLRLALGETLAHLAADEQLSAAIAAAKPARAGHRHG